MASWECVFNKTDIRCNGADDCQQEKLLYVFDPKALQHIVVKVRLSLTTKEHFSDVHYRSRMYTKKQTSLSCRASVQQTK